MPKCLTMTQILRLPLLNLSHQEDTLATRECGAMSKQPLWELGFSALRRNRYALSGRVL